MTASCIHRYHLLPLLLLLVLIQFSEAGTVEVKSDGSQHQAQDTPDSRNVTFVNERQEQECGLYWSGKPGSGPRLFYGPLAPKGGSRFIQGFPGQTFVLVEAGTYERLAEYTIAETPQQQQFTLNDDTIHNNDDSPHPHDSQEQAAMCRSEAASNSCNDCMAIAGCGWSVVRNKCYLSHPIATTIDKTDQPHPAIAIQSLQLLLAASDRHMAACS